ncbi:MAG: hypothetical protein NC238_15920 [Dehalobacter sp.]|nr:hypothetical protein [Dehalobacter sp.]
MNELLKVLELINSVKRKGLSKKELIDQINDNHMNSMFFSSYITLDDILEANILIGRLERDKGQIIVTEKGEKYLQKLHR